MRRAPLPDALRAFNPLQARHAFRTALAAVATYVICQALGLPQGYLAVLSVAARSRPVGCASWARPWARSWARPPP